jgi:hypothetical protein
MVRQKGGNKRKKQKKKQIEKQNRRASQTVVSLDLYRVSKEQIG